MSYLQAENNTSFDLKGDIEALSKNIGNISMINNSKIHDPNANVSQLEMDDLILKMMLEDGANKKGLPPNPYSHHVNHHQTQSYNINLLTQQPTITSENKHQLPPKDSKNPFQKESASLQRTNSKTSIHEEVEPVEKKVLRSSTTTNIQNQDEYRFDSGHEKKFENFSTNKLKNSSSFKNLESTSVQQQHFASVNEHLSKKYIINQSSYILLAIIILQGFLIVLATALNNCRERISRLRILKRRLSFFLKKIK